MYFVIGLLVCFAIFWGGMRLFWKRPIPAQIDSLRQGRAHHLLFGVLVGATLPDNELIGNAFGTVQVGAIGFGLMWFGVQTGLSLDLQNLRRFSLSGFAAQISCALPTVGFAAMAGLAGSTLFTEHLGVAHNLRLAILLLCGVALSTRFPEPTFRWSGTARPPSSDFTPTFQFGNTAALLLLTFGFPFCSEHISVRLGPVFFSGTPRVLVLLAAMGLMGGIAMDFVLRAYRNIAQGMAMAFGILVALTGICEAMGLPALAVGFLSGIWLVNATVVKRDVKERIARAGSVVEPLFFFMLGAMIAGVPSRETLPAAPLVPFALVILLVRSMGRILGFAVTRHLWQTPKTWGLLMELSVRPLGNLSAAIAAQTYFVLQLDHHALIAGLVLAIFFSQIILIAPVASEPRRSLVPISSRG